MNNIKTWKFTLVFALLAAIAYCIPAAFYIRDSTYSQTWILYLGVFMFLIVAIIYTTIDSNRRKKNVKVFRLMFDSHVITIISILISCLLCFIMLAVFIPGYLGSGPAEKALPDNPPNDVFDKTNGLSLKVFLTAIIGCFSAGSFVGILIPFYSSRRSGETSPEVAPLKQ